MPPKLILILTFALGVSTWTAEPALAKPTTAGKSVKIVTKDDLEKVEQKINELNQTLSCTADEDCVAIGVGYKACGGPYRYIVSSRKSENFPKLEDAIKKYNSQDKSYSNYHKLLSTCDVPSKPYGHCQINICQPIVPVPVQYNVHSIPPGATISTETRIQAPEDLKKIWQKNSYATLQEPPIIDFTKFDLIPWNFCKKETNGIVYFRLSQVGDVGQRLVVSYSKFNGCRQVDPSTCEIQFATVPKKEAMIEVIYQVQDCGNVKK